MKNIAIVGSTGSIGVQALEVIAEHPDRFRVVVLTAHQNVPLLLEQIERHRPRFVAISDVKAAENASRQLPGDVSAFSGEEGLLRALEESGADCALISIVGSAGMIPTLRAIECGMDIALANKETLVAGGRSVIEAIKKHNVALIPVDSEHSAIFQCLQGHADGTRSSVARLILTASGGPFFNRDPETLKGVTPEEAIKHPRWNMGAKISVDSATMMNKALEIIEARWLFSVPGEKISVLIHPESVVHSLVEYIDGSIIAHLGMADMRIPIAYALSYPERIPNSVAPLDLAGLTKTAGGLTFFDADTSRFPALSLAYEALKNEGSMPAVMSAANEAAVSLFMKKRIGFLDIVRIVSEVMEKHDPIDDPSIDTIISVDRWARAEAEKRG